MEIPDLRTLSEEDFKKLIEQRITVFDDNPDDVSESLNFLYISQGATPSDENDEDDVEDAIQQLQIAALVQQNRELTEEEELLERDKLKAELAI